MDPSSADRYTLPAVRPNRVYQSPAIFRFLRSGVVRWVVLLVLAPVLVLGGFAGAEFLAHSHEEHGFHLHAVSSGDARIVSAADHVADHGRDQPDPNAGASSDEQTPAGDEDPAGECDETDGTIIAIGHHQKAPNRGTSLSTLLTPALTVVAILTPVQPGPCWVSIAPPRSAGPVFLSTLKTGDRLVRTSCALLL